MIITKKVPSYDDRLLRQCYNFLSESYGKLCESICSWELFLEYRNYVYVIYDDNSNESNLSKTATTVCSHRYKISINTNEINIKAVFVFNRELHDKTFPLKFYCQQDGSLFIFKYIAFSGIELETLVSSLKSIMVEMNYTSVIYIGNPFTFEVDWLLSNSNFRVVYFYQSNKEIRLYIKDPTTYGQKKNNIEVG